MDRSRVAILGLAAIAAIVAALLVRGLFGGNSSKNATAEASPQLQMTQVLVAATDIQPGAKLVASAVKWQTWPKAAVSPSFISSDRPEDPSQILSGTVARTPVIAGQPLSTTNMVHAASAGFMSANLQAGMRAVSIQISDQTGASGFILPNDHVDVILTRAGNAGGATQTILKDVRVLAIGQTFQEPADQKVVNGKTATLEVAPRDAERLMRAVSLGMLTLSLRPLVDGAPAAAAADNDAVNIIRYAVSPGGAGSSQD